MMLFYYSLDAQRSRSESIFWGGVWKRLRGWFIISCCIVASETLMKYSALCWNIEDSPPPQEDYFNLLRHNNERGRQSKSPCKLPNYLWGLKSIEVDISSKDKTHVHVSFLDPYLICCAGALALQAVYIQSTELRVPRSEDGLRYAPVNITKRKVFTSFGMG